MATNPRETDVKTVSVIGTGTMGPGIAQVLAQHGVRVRVYDIDREQVIEIVRGETTDKGTVQTIEALVKRRRLAEPEFSQRIERIRKLRHEKRGSSCK